MPFVDRVGRFEQPARTLGGLTLCYALYEMYRVRRRSVGRKRQQISYFLLGMAIYAGAGLFLAGLPAVSKALRFDPGLVVFFSVFWMALIVYAMGRHRLFDIRIVLSRVLEALAPGRIDLGVGRAPGSDGITAHALNPYQNAAEDFPRQVHELRHWVSGIPLPEGHPHRSIQALPLGPFAPELWILGSSNYGAQLAAHFGLPYAFAYFFADGRGAEEALGLYRRLFRPSERNPTPQATICVWALAADTEEEALVQATTREYWRAGFEKGLRLPLASPEVARRHAYTPAELSMIANLRLNALVGTGAQVAEKLHALARRLELDEIVINTWTFDPEVRQHSYSLLAQAFGL